MTERNPISVIEELSLNAWPSLQQIVYDGWILRFADGYTGRPNSINVPYQGTVDLHEKIRRCEEIYLDKHLKPLFRLTPLSMDLDAALDDMGYVKVGTCSVQCRELDFVPEEPAGPIRVWSDVFDEWVKSFSTLSCLSLDEARVHARIVSNIATRRLFISVLDQGRVVSCVMGVMEDEYVGIFSLVTAEQERNKGFGARAVLSALSLAKSRGAEKAYLQVIVDNQAGLKLFAKLGFRELYEYWYRIKHVGTGSSPF